MQFSKITSSGKRGSFLGLLIKVVFILSIFSFGVVMLGKIDFPSPNKEIEKIIPNEKIKIVK
tara:strand:+ start:271 stop:456 length:186 start_codon:yes stop_codon:yes gene_type:complete